MLSSSLVIFIALIAVCCVVESKTNLNDFSVAYLAGSDHPQLVNAETVFQATPTAIQLADIYTRISGISPILAEGIDVLTKRSKKPLLLEVHSTEELSKEYSRIIASNTKGPQLQSVLHELHSRGIDAKGLSFAAKESASMQDWIQQHSAEQPVILLHHNLAATTGQQQQRRQLEDEESSVTPPTEFEISQYQICLWTAVGFVLILGASICTITQMEVIPDSLLYAKFQSGRTGQRSD